MRHRTDSRVDGGHEAARYERSARRSQNPDEGTLVLPAEVAVGDTIAVAEVEG